MNISNTVTDIKSVNLSSLLMDMNIMVCSGTSLNYYFQWDLQI